jgi:hypothetical protein
MGLWGCLAAAHVHRFCSSLGRSNTTPSCTPRRRSDRPRRHHDPLMCASAWIEVYKLIDLLRRQQLAVSAFVSALRTALALRLAFAFALLAFRRVSRSMEVDASCGSFGQACQQAPRPASSGSRPAARAGRFGRRGPRARALAVRLWRQAPPPTLRFARLASRAPRGLKSPISARMESITKQWNKMDDLRGALSAPVIP